MFRDACSPLSRFALKPLVLPVVVAIASTLSPVAIQPAHAATQSQAQSFSIPAGNLSAALQSFGRAAGVNLSFSPSLVAGKQTSGVTGTMTARQALERLLSGSGVVAQPVASGYQLKPATEGVEQLPTLDVSADAIAPLSREVLPTTAGGTISSGGSLGILGTQEAQNVPFSVISYTSDMIEEQHAETLADVVDNDASVQSGYGYDNYAQTFVVRGYELYNDDVSYGGLYGILPRQRASTVFADNVEVLKGANAFMDGVAPGGTGVGGAINMTPKIAGSDPITHLGMGYTSDSHGDVSTDFARRFGTDDAWGVRFSAKHEQGDTGIHDEDHKDDAALLSIDYSGERLSGSVTYGYENTRIDGARPVVHLTGLNSVPKAPDSDTNYGPDWANTHLKTNFLMGKLNYSLNDNWEVYGALGANHTDEIGTYPTVTVNNWAGDASVTMMDSAYQKRTFSGMGGIRGHFQTGSVSHKLNLAYSGSYQRQYNAYNMTFNGTPSTTNIYNPGSPANPGGDYASGTLTDPGLSARIRMQGVAFSDTLGFFDDQLLVTAGVRHQKLSQRSYTQGVKDSLSDYDQSKNSPVFGAVYKLTDEVSIYANHVEALQSGGTAPRGTRNVGSTLAPSTSRQDEAGIKYQGDKIGAALAVFQIKQPEAYTNADNVYGQFGEQRNQGVEMTVFGDLTSQLGFNAGVTYLKPEVVSSDDNSIKGNDAVGVARLRSVAALNYRVASVPGLKLNGKVVHTGHQYMDDANSLKLKPWTRFDVGASYSLPVADTEMKLGLYVENLTDQDYWASATGGYLTQGQPRTLKLSVSADF